MATPLPPPQNPHEAAAHSTYPVTGYTPPAPSPARPGGITFAGVLGIVYGALWGLVGLLFVLGGAFIASFLGIVDDGAGAAGPIGAFVGAFLGIIGFFILCIAAFGLAAGIGVLNGKTWGRWGLVALFSISALVNLAQVFLVYPLLFIALEATAIYMLVNNEANTYFGRSSGAPTYG